MNTEIQQKYHEKRKVKREIIQFSIKLKAQVFNGVIYSLDKSLKQKSITVTKRHQKKLVKLQKTKD